MKINEMKFLSNSELKIKLMEMENEYNACKSKIRDLIQKMTELDKAYTEGKTLLDKRTNGINL